MGQVLTGSDKPQDKPINAGLLKEIPCHIVNQACGSGLRSIASAYQSILVGDSNIVIAGL